MEGSGGRQGALEANCVILQRVRHEPVAVQTSNCNKGSIVTVLHFKFTTWLILYRKLQCDTAYFVLIY